MKKISKSIISLILAITALMAFATPASALSADTASSDDKNAASHTSEVALNETELTMIVGEAFALELNGTSKKVHWFSIMKSVAAVSPEGEVTAEKEGTAFVVARVGFRFYVCTVTVEQPSISDSSKTLIVGQTAELSVKDTTQDVEWYSSDKTVATVSDTGKVTAHNAGKASVTAKVGTMSYTCSVKVESPSISEATKSMFVGQSSTLTLKNNSQSVEWSSDNKSVVSVTSDGKITASKTGTATITAKVGSKSYTCKITVQDPYISAKSKLMIAEDTFALSVKGASGTVTWSSSNKAVATVTSAGKVTALKAGTATITAKVGNKSYTCSVTVEAPYINVEHKTMIAGATLTLAVKGTSQTVSWSSSNKAIATVTSEGKVTARKAGAVVIKAEVADHTYSCTIVINSPVDDELKLPTKFTEVKSLTICSMQFTLDAATAKPLTSNDVSIICSAGGLITIYDITTKDNKTYTVSTSYYKNKFYDLFVTLPSGIVIDRTFSTDFEVPNMKMAKVTRSTDTIATLEIYDLDEGGNIYYVLDDSSVNNNTILSKGVKAPVQVGYNYVTIPNLQKGKAYSLYYAIEGFYNNVSAVQGPIEIVASPAQEDETDIKIIYASEETPNKFVFKLNKLTPNELTLGDFKIKCPTDTSELTISGAEFRVWEDGLTYEIIVPSNYIHKDNGYTVQIDLGDGVVIKKEFRVHFNPPSISGETVKRVDDDTVTFTFNSDEYGTVYYGMFQWNGAMYWDESNVPMAIDVVAGKVSSQKQAMNSGKNVITLNIPKSSTTGSTRIWLLYVDEKFNYRTGFVDHYSLNPNVVIDDPYADAPVIGAKVVYADDEYVALSPNSPINGYSVTQDSITLTINGDGYIAPGKLAYMIQWFASDNELGIYMNFDIAPGSYKFSIKAKDTNDNPVIIEATFTI